MRGRAVIVGGGVIGASVAWHLLYAGWRDVIVLDAGSRRGSGSTGRATGGFRSSFGTALNIRLSQLSRRELADFNEVTGGRSGFVPVGYLWLATNEAELADLRRGLDIQHQEGLLESREVTVDEIAALNPAVDLGPLIGGTFCPSDGYIVPLGLLDGFLDDAHLRGARIRFGNRVTGFSVHEHRITQVNTDEGAIECDVVVNAAGAWAREVARMAGVALPVEPLRRQIVPTEPTTALPATMPMTLWAGDGFHFRVRDDRVLLAWPTPGDTDDPYRTDVSDGWVAQVEAMARERIPGLASVRVMADEAWGGLYEVSPDKHPILGWAPECQNLMLVNGASGHGVMHSLALGRLASEIMTDGVAQSMDVRALRPERFADGEPIAGGGLL